MTIQASLILLALSLAAGCPVEGPTPTPEQAATRPATRPVADPTPSPATAPSARVVEAVQVRTEGRNRIRTFELRPGDAFQTERGGTVKVGAIRDGEIVFDRTYPGWKIPARPAEHSIGNWEYVKVVSVDPGTPSLRLELRTVTKKHPWEALSF